MKQISLLVRIVRTMVRRMGTLWTGVSLVAMAGFLLAAGAFVGFAALADEVLEGETQRVDEAVLEWVAGHRVDWLDTVALEITSLGSVATLVVVALSAAAILWAGRRRVSVALLFLALSTGAAVNFILKAVFGRPRPRVVAPLADALTASFPSGHAMMAAITYGTVAFLVGRMAKGALRWVTWAGAALLVVLIGLTRIYVGAHYPSDVVAGWLAGIAWTGLLVALFRALGAFAREAPELAAMEPELESGEGC